VNIYLVQWTQSSESRNLQAARPIAAVLVYYISPQGKQDACIVAARFEQQG